MQNTNSARPLSILVVDDDSSICDLIRELIFDISPSYSVTGASDGIAALDQIKQNKFDLLIMDMVMPKMDGRGLIESLAELPKDGNPDHILVISGNLSGGARKLGRCTFLPKPFGAEDLEEYFLVTFGSGVKVGHSTAQKPVFDDLAFGKFEDGLEVVLASLCATRVRQKKRILPPPRYAGANLSVISSLNSTKYRAVLAIHLEEATLLKLVERILGETLTEMTSDTFDVVAEISNQVIGFAKVKLNLNEHDIHAAIHSVIASSGQQVIHFSEDARFVSQLETDIGSLTLEISVRGASV